MKKQLFPVICILLLLSVLTVNVSALEEPDVSRTGSISITMTYQGTAVPGGSLTLYRVAEVHEENGADYSFRLIYENCPVSLDRLDDAATAQALADYVAENEISGTKLPIRQDGTIYFEDLELGLYLLVQQDAAEGFGKVNPFLVSVPVYQDGSYLYEVDASPKVGLTPTEPDEPPPDDPPPPDLPQTGQLQWPIPILAIGGLIMVVFGICLQVYGRKKNHET